MTTAPPAVQRWQRRLLDLSTSNPLLSLPSSSVELKVDEKTLPAIEDFVANGTEVLLRAAEDLEGLNIPEGTWHSDELEADTLLDVLHDDASLFCRLESRGLRRDLAHLRRRGAIAREESGASSLFLTLGGLRWTSDDRTHTAPLFLLPITLEGRRHQPYTVQLEAAARLRSNECLIEWLRHAHGLDADVLSDPPTDDSGIDVTATFAELRAALAEQPGFEVVADVRVALLESSSLDMWRDLTWHWPALTLNPLVRHVVSEAADPFVDLVQPAAADELDEHALAMPLAADGSQTLAVRWAHEGCTFVLEGPPGTGKSQTIANIVADSLHAGRRILFVAEKEAALEAVARRIAATGLLSFCLDLHHRDQTARRVRTQLTALLQHHRSPSDEWSGLARRYRDLIGDLTRHPHAIRAMDAVVSVDADERRRMVDEFDTLDRRRRSMLGPAIAAERLAQIRPGDWHGDDPLATLRRELRVPREGGIRELIDGHARAILTLTPCVLASPSTVARYLPALPDLFDLVVFDEASQIRVPDAVGAMGRGRSVVIVGDPRQMPPSDLFADGERRERDNEADSLLTEALRVGVPRHRLDWHYRSRVEGLVAFSNDRYYDGRLATFPTPPGLHSGSGTEFRRIPGAYETGRGGRRANLTEAVQVYEDVVRRLTDDPATSLGVITFNESQRDAILDKLEADSAPDVVHDALRRPVEPLFVKTLEHVQGDERDHILFSLTYSTGPDGRLPANFGRLSAAGGERRLNVAITRARVSNTLFCSFDPHDITPSPTSEGPTHLRDFLLVAQSGQTLTPPPWARARRGGPWQDAVADRLRREGLTVVDGVGLSTFTVDLAVRAPGGGWLAVQLDTPEWAARRTTSDRDLLPRRVLQGHMGWADVVQLYRSEWEADPDQVAASITALARSLTDVATHTAPVTSFDPVLAAVHIGEPRLEVASTDEVADKDATPTGITMVDFVPADETARLERDVLNDLPRRAAEVAEQWRDVAAIEGPVLLDRAMRTVIARFGWQRPGARRRQDTLDCIPDDLPRTTDGAHIFLWPPGSDPEQYRTVRGGPRAGRKIDEIGPHERANAARLVLAEGGGESDVAALIQGMTEVFGFAKVGTVLRRAFTATLRDLAEQGEIELLGSKVRSVPGRPTAVEDTAVDTPISEPAPTDPTVETSSADARSAPPTATLVHAAWRGHDAVAVATRPAVENGWEFQQPAHDTAQTTGGMSVLSAPVHVDYAVDPGDPAFTLGLPSTRPGPSGLGLAVVRSAAYAQHRAMATALIDDHVIARVVDALAAAPQARLSFTDLATVLDRPIHRVPGAMSWIMRQLNLDGYDIVSSQAQDAHLDVALLREQFGID